MAWIKKHPHLVVLILVSLGVLAASAKLVLDSRAFDQNFDAVRQTPPKGTKVYEQEQKAIQAAKTEFQMPTVWKAPIKHFSLFISDLYLVEKGKNNEPDKLVPPDDGSRNTDSLTKEPIPNKWFLDNQLPVFANGVSRQDPDNDGFWNEDEWRAKTNPNNATSHPPLHSKLFVVKYIRVPFLLKFQGYDGDPAKPEDFTVQINTLSLRQPTLFLHLGETVPKTKFKIEKFEKKMEVSPNGTEIDTSTLTLVDTESGLPVVLINNKITDSPDSYALFKYLLLPSGKDLIQVKKLQQFALLPEKDQLYKLLDISEEKAVIQTPSGEKLDIPKLPAGYP